MKAQLLVELLLDAGPPEQRAKTQTKLPDPTHGVPVLGSSDDERDGGRQSLPLRALRLQRFPAGPREGVELCAAVVLALAPLGFDPPLLLELVQRRVQRALPHAQLVVGHLSDP